MSPVQYKSSRYDLAVNTINQADIEQVIAWMRQYPKLTMGDETRRFEQAWSKWLGVKYSVMCNSGASANLLMYAALDAAGLSGNRKVVLPPRNGRPISPPPFSSAGSRSCANPIQEPSALIPAILKPY